MWIWLNAWSFAEDFERRRAEGLREHLIDSEKIESIEAFGTGTFVRLASGKILYTDVRLSDFAETLNCESPIVDFRGTLRRQRDTVAS